MERGERNSHSPGPNVNYFDGANIIGHLPFSSAAASMVTTSPFSPLTHIPSAFSMLGRPPLFPATAPFGGLGTLEGFGLRSPFASGLSPTTGGADWWRLASEHARRLAAGGAPDFFIGGLGPSLSPTFGLHTSEASPTGFDALLRQSQSSIFGGLTSTPLPVSEGTISKSSAASSKDTLTTTTVTSATAKSTASTTLSSSRTSPASVSSHGKSTGSNAGRSSSGEKSRKNSSGQAGIPTSVITSIPKMAESSLAVKEHKHEKMKSSKMGNVDGMSDSDSQLDLSSGSLSMDTPSELSSDEEGDKEKHSLSKKDLKRKSDAALSGPPDKKLMTSNLAGKKASQSVEDTARKNQELLMNSPLSITDCIARQQKLQQMASLDPPKHSSGSVSQASASPLDLSKKDSSSAFSVPGHHLHSKTGRKSRKAKYLQQQQQQQQQQQVMSEKERSELKKRQEQLKVELEAQLKQQQLELKLAKKAAAEREKQQRAASQQNTLKGHKGRATLSSSSPSLSQSSRSSKTSQASMSKVKIEVGESGLSDDSSGSGSDSGSESSSSSGSSSESESEGESGSVGKETTGDEEDKSKRRKRRTFIDESEIRIPLEHGWRRETRIRTMSNRGIVGDVMYYGPCGKKLRSYPEVTRYLEKNAITDLTRDNFTFSPKVSVGDFLEQKLGDGENGFSLLTAEEVMERLMLNKMKKLHQADKVRKRKERKKKVDELAKQAAEHKMKKKLEQQEMTRKAGEMKIKRKLQKSQQAEVLKRAKQMRAIERKKAKEQERMMRQQEKLQRQEHLRIEREVRAQQLLEERQRRREEVQNLKVAEMMRRAKEREMKRQQAVILKEQEREQRRRMLVMASMERERRRQHMLLVKALEARKRQEERERMREEKNIEKRMNRQRKFEQRQYEMQVARELKKPIEDMKLADQKPLPELQRIKGVKLAGQALADSLMVIEFLNNFGIALGFDLDSLPTLSTLQLALLNDDEYIDEFLSLITHLLKFALEDPGVPNPKDAVTALGHKITDIEINDDNLSEILRLFIVARNGKPDEMSNLLLTKPLTALNPTHKAAILAFMCNELLSSKNIASEIDKNIDKMSNLRREKWVVEGKVRKLRTLQARKFNRPVPQKPAIDMNDSSLGIAENSLCNNDIDSIDHNVSISSKRGSDDEDDDKDSEDSDAGEDVNISDEEDEPTTIEEFDKKLERLSKQHSQFREKVFQASHKLRAMTFGQDRYKRRYWVLPFAGGIYVEGLESAEPEAMTKIEWKVPVDAMDVDLEKLEAKSKRRSEELKSKVKLDKSCANSNSLDNEKPKDSIGAENNQNSESSNNCDAAKNGDSKSLDAKENGTESLGVVEAKLESVSDPKPEVDGLVMGEKGAAVGEVKREVSDLAGVVKEEKRDDECAEKISIKTEPVVKTEAPDNEEKFTIKSESNPVKIENGDLVNEPDSVKSKAIKMDLDFIESKDAEKVKIKEEIIVKSEPTLVNGNAGTPPADPQFQTPRSILNLSDIKKSESPSLKDTPNKSDLFTPSSIKSGAESTPSFMSIDSILKKEEPGTSAYNNSCSPYLPFPPAGPLTAEQMLKNLSERQGQKPWFSILPRMPCDESTLTRAPNNMPRINNTSPSPSPSPFFLPVPYSAFQVHNPMFASFQMGQLQYSPFNFSLTGSGYQPMKTSGILNDEEGTPPHYSRSNETSTPNTSMMADSERLAEAKPIPIPMQRGWWRITNAEELRGMIRNLHSRGICEKLLQKSLQKYADYACESCVKGNNEALELEVTDLDKKFVNVETGTPDPDAPHSYLRNAIYEINMNILDEVENMEERVYGASLQIKGWKIPPHSSSSEDEKADKDKDKKEKTEKKDSEKPKTKVEKEAKAEKEARKQARLKERKLKALDDAKLRLLTLEKNIERRYLKPPLNKSLQLNIPVIPNSGDPKAAKPEKEDETQVSQGLLTWRRSVETASSAAQLHMSLVHLNNCIAWEKSIMKVICQICLKDDNEAQLLLCDGCDKGYHTYCFKPKMDTIPEGEWYCFECVTKATGTPHCVVCGKKGGRLAECDHCPRCFHVDCLIPPLPRVPRKWSCVTCATTKTKGKKRKQSTASKDVKEKEGGKAKKEKDAEKKEEKPESGETPEDGATAEKKEKGEKDPASGLDESSDDMSPCRTMMQELESHDKAWPFLKAVNCKQFPQYKKIIRHPMDFGTMKNKLRDKVYKLRSEFSADARLIFNNCETFNEDESEVGSAGHTMRKFFETQWAELLSAGDKKE